MRGWGKAALVAAVLVVAVALAGVPVLVVPATDDPATVDADVAFVIGPPTDARMEVAYDLVAAGRADALMVSLDPAEHADWPLAAQACTVAELQEATDGFADLGAIADGEAADRVSPDSGTPVLCAKPDPFTTRGEARWLEQEMAEHGWDSAAVITLTPHISRARMIMERCETGDIAMVDVEESLDPWFWAYMYGYQSLGFAKAAVLQGC